MKKEIINKIPILLIALLVAFEFIFLTNIITEQKEEINKLKDRIKYIEINYQLDEYNRKQLEEYFKGEL